MASRTLRRMGAGMLSSLLEPGSRNTVRMVSSSARRMLSISVDVLASASVSIFSTTENGLLYTGESRPFWQPFGPHAPPGLTKTAIREYISAVKCQSTGQSPMSSLRTVFKVEVVLRFSLLDLLFLELLIILRFGETHLGVRSRAININWRESARQFWECCKASCLVVLEPDVTLRSALERVSCHHSAIYIPNIEFQIL